MRAGSFLRLLRPAAPPRPADPDGLGPVGRRVEALLDEAVARGASDLHLDPGAGGTRVRLRVDGFFEEGERLAPELEERAVARIKVLAGLTVYRRDEVQEGSIRRAAGVDLRVSILPTVAGEKVTIRVFDPRTRPFGLDGLGFRPAALAALERLAALGQGTVVVAGPSGSGKTTTLYAMLRRIRDRRGAHSNVCSVEDPAEYALAGVHQVAVNPERGLDFARALRALLRQDPEVILVGEVRDRETARIAVEAGLTGHLVLTSVHAGGAAEALCRLLDLGVEPSLLATAVKGVVAQRLVRRVCAACAALDAPDPGLVARLGAGTGTGTDIGAAASFRAGAGCPACRHTGYAGRLPLAEVLVMDSDLARLLPGRPEARALARHLAGGDTLLRDGVAHARAGATTLAEVARVVEPEAEPW